MASRRQTMQLVRQHEKLVMRAYVDSVRGKQVSVKDVEAVIDDIDRLYELIELDGGDVSQVNEAIREAFKDGGNQEGVTRSLKGKFDINAERATDMLLRQTSRLIANINEQQRDAVREIVAAGRALGESPRTTALDIVGRVKKSGAREGGVIGLNGPQAAAVKNAKENLRSGDPEFMRKYLSNRRRDRRYDAVVKKYIAEGKLLPQSTLHKITTRYQARLLQTRGETVARTETIEAINAGKQESVRQQSAKLGMTAFKVWIASKDSRTRDDHDDMDGERVPIDEPYILPDGSQVMYPSDSELGAAAGQIINCRCTERYEFA